jgi:hypothetical protein
MYERVIIVPNKDNNGVSLASVQRAIEHALLGIVGGFTVDKVNGAWRGEGGRTYRDESKRYTLAVDAEQDRLIQVSLPVWCELARQECLFTSRREVEVEFVYPSAVAQSA